MIKLILKFLQALNIGVLPSESKILDVKSFNEAGNVIESKHNPKARSLILVIPSGIITSPSFPDTVIYEEDISVFGLSDPQAGSIFHAGTAERE